MNKQCVNCPGAQDHSTAECPVMKEQKMASERSAFEQWVVTRKFVSGQGKHYVESCLHRDLAGEYTQGWVHGAWVGWQARNSVLVTMPPEIPRYLLGKIVDEVFDGAIEDPRVIEDVYRVIAREQLAAPAVVNQQVTTAASLPVGVPDAEPVLIQAVAVTRDDEEGLRLEWLLEGGIAEMEFAGQVLFAMPEANSLCDEDGSAHVYIAPPPAPTVKESLSVAARDVLAERQRQITAEGYDSSHDDMATRGQLAIAAGCYAIWSGHPALMGTFSWKSFFPWEWKYWKPSTPRHNLIRAGALILAEIERLDRAEQAKQQEQQR